MRTFESVADLVPPRAKKVGRKRLRPSPRKRSTCSPTQRVITSDPRRSERPLRVLWHHHRARIHDLWRCSRACNTRCTPSRALKLAINYGLNKVRLPAPVPVGSRVRATSSLVGVEDLGAMMQATVSTTVEVEGSAKRVWPSIVRYVA